MSTSPRSRRWLALLGLLALVATVGAAVATGAASVTRTIATGSTTTYQVIEGVAGKAVALHGTDSTFVNGVSVITLSTGAVGTQTGASAIFGAYFGAAAGGRIYLANERTTATLRFGIGTLDTATGAPLGAIEIPSSSVPAHIAVTPDGRTVVAFNDGDSAYTPNLVSVMTIPAGTATGTNHTVAGPANKQVMGYAFSSDSRYAYLAFGDGGGFATVSRIDLASGTVSPVDVGLSGADEPAGVAASRDGARLAVNGDNGALILHAIATGANTPVSGLTGNANASPTFSADGATLYATTSAGRLYTIDAATATIRATYDFSSRGGLNCAATATCLQLTADGRQLLFPIDATATTSDLVGVLDTRAGALSYVTVGQSPRYVWPSSTTADAYVTYGSVGGGVTVLQAASAPGAPTGVTATAGLTSARVTWVAPTDDGGSTVTRYTATASPGGRTCSWTTGELACTITDLPNTTAYTITVAAENLAGAGAASAPSAAVRPYKTLAMRAPKAAGTTIRSKVKVAGAGTITQTGTLTGVVCRATAKPKKKGTVALTCAINKAGRTALRKKAQTVTVLTTLLTKQGATFVATHRVKVPKTR